MGLSFHETMQGTFTDRWGKSVPIDFTVKVEAPRLRAFWRDGKARLTGVVNAPPLATNSPLDGTITIRALPLQGQFIRYEFGFTGPDDARYAFYGQKNLSTLQPFASIGNMRGCEVRHDDDVVLRGDMWFNFDEVVNFFGTSTLETSVKQLPLDASSPDGLLAAAPLGAVDRALLEAFADAAIEPGVHVPAADALTVDKALEVLSHMPAGTATAFAGVLRALDALCRVRHGRGFATLDRERRVALLDALDQIPGYDGLSGGLSPHQVLHLVGMPVRAAHFDRPDYLANIGAPTYQTPVREADPRWTTAITTAEDLGAETRIDCDVVVVGTGAGGGAIAAKLAEQGLAVAILEEGRFQGRKQFQGSPIDRMRSLWRNAGMTFSVGNPPISLPMGRMVGGTTAINSGTCFRAPEHVFEDWRRDCGLSDDFSASGMDAYYDAVEQELQVAPASTKHLGSIAEIVKKGADEMGLANAPLPRNAPGCDGQGACVFGCPTDAKRSSNVSWIPRAVNAGASLFTGLPVTRLLQRGRTIVAVEARGPDAHGVQKVLRVHAKAVVLACGALVTPHVLLQNGFDLPMLGKNLSVHPEIGMWARLGRDCAPWAAIPQSYGISGLEHEGIKFEGFYVPPQVAGATIPLLGKELTRWMDGYGQTAQYGFMVKDPGNGSVGLGLDGRPMIRYNVDPGTHKRLQKGIAVLSEVLIRGGADEVMVGVRRQPHVRTLDQARALMTANIRTLDWNLLGSHPLGTCRIGASSKVAVCDPEHRVFGTDNLYVADGSSVPTSLGVNPQLTIMAMALRAGEAIASRVA